LSLLFIKYRDVSYNSTNEKSFVTKGKCGKLR
jgi:hypothetical protein